MPCNGAHMGGILEEEREGAEKGTEKGAERGQTQVPGKEAEVEEREREEIGKAYLIKGNVVSEHRRCS